MKKIHVLIIAILGVALIASVARNATLKHQLDETNAETERLIIATEEVFKEVEDFVWVNYNVSLKDTLWQGDIYNEWYGAYEAIVCL